MLLQAVTSAEQHCTGPPLIAPCDTLTPSLAAAQVTHPGSAAPVQPDVASSSPDVVLDHHSSPSSSTGNFDIIELAVVLL